MINKRFSIYQLFIYIPVFIFSLFCLLPFWLVVSGSLTSEQEIVKYGYSLIPRSITILAYRVIFNKPDTVLNAYKISAIVTVAGVVLSVFIMSMAAYTISRKNLKFAKHISFYSLLTILFSGGMVPWYIICINYLHLKDKLIALIVPYLCNAWYIFLLKNFFQTIPDALHDSAKIDGAGELRVFVQIVLPLSMPVIATVSLFMGLRYWNDWWLSLMLIDKEGLRPIQYMLRVIVSNTEFLKNNMSSASELNELARVLPDEGLRMAISVIALGPILVLYPFLQKYFIKGIMIGAVKG